MEYAGQPPFWQVATNEIDILDDASDNYANNRLYDYTTYFVLPAPFYKNPVYVTSYTFGLHGRTIADTFHLFSCLWDPDSLNFYMDDTFLYSIPYDNIRNYPDFNTFTIDLNAWTETRSGWSMYVDSVRIWRKNCNPGYLGVSEICSTTGIGHPRIIPPGLYKYDSIVSINTTMGGDELLPGINRANAPSPIIFEANSTTLLPNFVADESVLMHALINYGLVDPWPPAPMDTGTQISNGYLMILPLVCDDDNSANYKWFRTMTQDSAKPYSNLSSKSSPASIAAESIIIAPNPVNTTLNIAYPCRSAGQLQITITDVVGRIVYAEAVNCTDGKTVQQSIDMSAYQQGVYFVSLTLSSEHIVKKIVKL